MDWNLIPQLGAVGMLCLAVLVLARVIWWQMDKRIPIKSRAAFPEDFAIDLANRIVTGLESSKSLSFMCADCPVQEDVAWVKEVLFPRKLSDRDVYDWKWSAEDKKILHDLQPALAAMTVAVDNLSTALPELLKLLEQNRAVQEKTLRVLRDLDTPTNGTRILG